MYSGCALLCWASPAHPAALIWSRFAAPSACSTPPPPRQPPSLPARCSGRKRAALTYCATYAAGCVTKHFNSFWVLCAGRVLCGIATSLLFSAFESWLVSEHFKRGFAADWLGGTFSSAVFLGNGLMAILAGGCRLLLCMLCCAVLAACCLPLAALSERSAHRLSPPRPTPLFPPSPSSTTGLVANGLVETLDLGPVAPFDAAATVLIVGGLIIAYTW